MDRDKFVEYFPCLYHLSWSSAKESIKQHGLLSTRCLLDLFEIPEPNRRTIIEEHRDAPIHITHEKYGQAIIRDTCPLNPKRLPTLLTNNMTPQQYRRLLNDRVFFWLDPKRLKNMLRSYSDSEHIVFRVNSKSLLEKYSKKIHLSRINSGAIICDAKDRGVNTFEDFCSYQFGSIKDKPAELTVLDKIPDFHDFVIDETHHTNI